MQHADQREKATRGIGIYVGLTFKSLLQDAAAFVVDAATGHVDGFDLAGRQSFHRVEIAFAYLKIIFDHLPEWPQRQVKFCRLFFGLSGDVEDQPFIADRQLHTVWSIRRDTVIAHRQRKAVFFQQIIDRNLTLLLNLGGRRRQVSVVKFDSWPELKQLL